MKAIRPMLWTGQVRETINFYEQLGFTCAAYSESWHWAALQRDEVEIMVCLPPDSEAMKQPAFTGSLYILLDEGVDQLWEVLKTKANICYAPETFAYGMREFALYDNNGYLLQFGQEVIAVD